MLLLLASLVALAQQPPGATEAGGVTLQGIQRGCPPEHENAAMRVRTLLTSSLLPEMRRRFNLGTALAEDTRLLANESDRTVCRSLWDAIEASGASLSPGDRVSFYRSGNTYFVPVTRHRRPARPGALQLDGYSSLDVYDAAFRLVGRFGA